ncbi:hypothetical protein ASE00_01535 [Sphingomonas sp. Root710]|uniref:hypothetical protein n=1 Tax=Sphingomonas sp. Root710 TaxID=1736594 RepID=UPI0006FD5671|nr:hypothetical protein [Sphingomonas sp. Root710]KRB85506.1 hypothetical protein ASE00_01535 [Sphingomonas sp. Root710]
MSRINGFDDMPGEENREQVDDGQADAVAEDALHLGDDPAEESERAGGGNPAALIPDDVPDLVDKMTEMVRSGHIDNGAFAGEPMHDDEEGYLGETDNDLDE